MDRANVFFTNDHLHFVTILADNRKPCAMCTFLSVPYFKGYAYTFLQAS